MRIGLLVAVSLLVASLSHARPASQSLPLSAVVNGTQIVDGPGDADGQGSVSLIVQRNGNLTYSVALTGLDDATELRVYRVRPGTPIAGLAFVFRTPIRIVNGLASGTEMLTQPADSILARPESHSVVITSTANPLGAVRGNLIAAPVPGEYVLPVVGRVPGGGGTLFRTDIRLANPFVRATEVVLEFYESSAAGLTEPTSRTVITIAAQSEAVMDDVMKAIFNREQVLGAMIVRSQRPLRVTARIYNDQRAAGLGTFGQFEVGQDSRRGSLRDDVMLPHLINDASFRTNLGWFNAGDQPVALEFSGISAAGPLGSRRVIVPAKSHQQLPATTVFGFGDVGTFWLNYSAQAEQLDTDPIPVSLYVYASVIDNRNGDAIFVPAQEP